MPLAVLDLDFARLPSTIGGLERYEGALILLRLNERPVGQALLPIVDGRLGGDDLRGSLLRAADSSFWEAWFNEEYLQLRSEQPPTAPQPSASIAVCTRDRTEDLSRCLDALMRLPDDGQEILIVDNCPSSEATRELVARFPQVRYVREDRPGLNVARNRALREARNDVIAFTDDDAAPDPAWLRKLLRNFADPLVMAATGLTMALELETEAQERFQHYGGFGRGFKRIVFDGASHEPLLGWQAGAGVNMAVRRNVSTLIGPFDEALDAGTPTHAGGDSDLFRRALAAGYRIVYDPEAVNWHRHRYRWEELRRQIFGYEVASSAIWTRSLVFEGNVGALLQAWRWLRKEFPVLRRSLLGRPGSKPRDIALSQFRGAALGPWRYFYSFCQARKRRGIDE